MAAEIGTPHAQARIGAASAARRNHDSGVVARSFGVLGGRHAAGRRTWQRIKASAAGGDWRRRRCVAKLRRNQSASESGLGAADETRAAWRQKTGAVNTRWKNSIDGGVR